MLVDHLYPLRCQELLHGSGVIDRGVVPVQKLVLGLHDGLFLSKNYQEPSQGLLHIFGIDGFAPVDAVSVDDALGSEEE